MFNYFLREYIFRKIKHLKYIKMSSIKIILKKKGKNNIIIEAKTVTLFSDLIIL